MFSQTHIHLVGIGGIGMSGLARILRAHGRVVTGSDRERSEVVERLVKDGFDVAIGEDASHVSSDTEVVVHTLAAKPEANIELIEAAQRRLPTFTYPEALGEITKNKKLVAVAGTHGKSTTTGMLIAAALAAGVDVSCLVGTNLPELDGVNARVGTSDIFILEACEYRRAFLNLTPSVVLVTNVDLDHLDYYRDLADYQSAFVELVKKMLTDGALIVNYAEPNIAPLIEAASRVIDAAAVTDLPTLTVAGEHNRKNAHVAIAAADLLGFEKEKSRAGVAAYAGAWRRFELKGEVNGAPIFDDYGHHPTEIRATLQAARERFPDRRIIVCYQQHQLDRAQKFLHEIGTSFGDADVVLIPNIYRVRDDGAATITGADIAAEIRKNKTEAIFADGFERTVAWLRENVTSNDAVVVMGAGDVYRVTEMLIAA